MINTKNDSQHIIEQISNLSQEAKLSIFQNLLDKLEIDNISKLPASMLKRLEIMKTELALTNNNVTGNDSLDLGDLSGETFQLAYSGRDVDEFSISELEKRVFILANISNNEHPIFGGSHNDFMGRMFDTQKAMSISSCSPTYSDDCLNLIKLCLEQVNIVHSGTLFIKTESGLERLVIQISKINDISDDIEDESDFTAYSLKINLPDNMKLAFAELYELQEALESRSILGNLATESGIPSDFLKETQLKAKIGSTRVDSKEYFLFTNARRNNLISENAILVFRLEKDKDSDFDDAKTLSNDAKILTNEYNKSLSKKLEKLLDKLQQYIVNQMYDYCDISKSDETLATLDRAIQDLPSTAKSIFLLTNGVAKNQSYSIAELATLYGKSEQSITDLLDATKHLLISKLRAEHRI